MSYDISIWCVEAFQDKERLPDAAAWALENDGWTLAGRTWALHGGPSDEVLEEDVPGDVFALLPGIRHVVHLSLEPIGAPAAGFRALQKAAKAIAKSAKGVILDAQTEEAELPSGVRRYAEPPPAEEGITVLELSWWMDHASLLERARTERLLDLLEKHLPEALPRRYGLHEPPRHELAKEGRDHLLAFLEQHATEGVILYPSRPVLTVHLSIDRSFGWRRLGGTFEYRCNRLAIGVEARALEQEGWETGLRRLWRDLSLELRPFFGDVRSLSGYLLNRGRLHSDRSTENHPVCSWWWKGIPPRLGHAAVIGPAYLDLWPTLAARAEVINDLAFVSTPSWREGNDAAELTGGVPQELALPFMAHWATDQFGGRSVKYPDSYPPLFPFARPSDSTT